MWKQDGKRYPVKEDLFSIATGNGTTLILHVKHLTEEDGVTDFRQVRYSGTSERLALILVTAMSTELRLIPNRAGTR